MRHAPELNGNATVEGSLQMLLGEEISLQGNAAITGDLLVPGSPSVQISGSPAFGGTLIGTGSAFPAGYRVQLKNNATLGHLRTRTDPVALPSVPVPPMPTGTRNVVITAAGQSAGNWSTVRNLTLNGNAGVAAVPAGTYGDFTVNGGGALRLGAPGSALPLVYNLQRLTLNGPAQLLIAGPVILNVRSGFRLNGHAGTSATAPWLTLNISSGDLQINGGASLYAHVNAPGSKITINGNALLEGGLRADALRINGGGVLRLRSSGPDGNQPPTAQAQAVSASEDTVLGVTLAATDVDGDPLTFRVITPPAHGALSGTAPHLIYTPAADFFGSDTFAFVAHDGTADSAPATVALTVQPVNDPPALAPQTLVVAEDGELVVQVLGTDVDGDSLTYTVASAPLHGVLVLPFSNLRYQPAANFAGIDEFRIRVEDGHGGSAEAAVSISVTPENDAPVAQPLAFSVLEDSLVAVQPAGADVDGDPLTFEIVESPGHGRILGASPDFHYLPEPDYFGPDRFTYRANDGQVDSAPVEVLVNVLPLNDAPTVDAQDVELDEDGTVAIGLSGSDPEGDPLSFLVVTPPAHGTLIGSGASSFVYRPEPNFAGTDRFFFRSNDGDRSSAPAAVEIRVRPVNDPPAVIVVAPLAGTIFEFGEPIAVRATASDIEDAVTEIRLYADGTLLASAAGPIAEFFWTGAAEDAHTLHAVARDASGAETQSAPVTIEVSAIASGPVRVDAGPDALIALPAHAPLAATVTLNDEPAGANVQAEWQVIAGPGEVTFGSDAALATDAFFTVPGEYRLRLVATLPEGSASDTLRVTVNPAPEPGPEPPVSNAGREFWLAFLEQLTPFNEPDHAGSYLLLDAAAAASGTVEIFNPSGGTDSGFRQIRRVPFDIAAGAQATVPIDTFLPPSYDASHFDRALPTAIRVRSDQPVSIAALNISDFSTDAALILPTGLLGQEYFVMGYRNTQSFHEGSDAVVGSTQFAVVATQDQTRVEITPSAASETHAAGQTFSVTLSAGEVFRMRNRTDPVADFTGTEIHADKPVAVFGGNSIALVPTRTAAGDHLYEQMPPVALWGTNFVTMPLKTRTGGDRFRFLAARDQTRVAVNGRVVATLRRGGFYETVLTEPAHIVADQPILVGQFAHGSGFDNTTGDPFFMLVPPYQQFGRAYRLQTPVVNSHWTGQQVDIFESYLSVIARVGHEHEVRVNGAPIAAADFQPLGASGFAGASIAVPREAQLDIQSAEPIGAWLYGWANFESYGLMGGLYAAGSFPGVLELTQAAPNAPVGGIHAVRARLLSANGSKVPGARIAFDIVGANPGSGVVAADADGIAEFTWHGVAPGTDTFTARSGTQVQTLSVLWLEGAPNAPPVVEAGPPVIANPGESVVLNGSATDDGVPAGQPLMLFWEKVSGEGDVTFSPPNGAQTSATFSHPGIYRLRLYASDGQFASSDETTVQVNSPPHFIFVSPPNETARLHEPWIVSFVAEDVDGTIQRIELLQGEIVRERVDVTDGGEFSLLGISTIFTESGLYPLTLRITDDRGASATLDFVVRATAPPEVRIIEPTGVAQIRVGESLLFRAAASDPDGTVTSVEYLEAFGGFSLGMGGGPDFALTFTPDFAAEFDVVAVATDDAGIVTISAPVRLRIVQNTNVVIRLVAPAADVAANIGEQLTWRAQIENPDNVSIWNVRFMVDDAQLGTASQEPYSGRWMPAEARIHRLSVRAFNGNGLLAVSDEVTLEVVQGLQVHLSAPTEGARVPAGVPLRLEAKSTDPAGVLRRYAFSVDDVSLGETAAPSVEWTPQTPGVYALRAGATDRFGNIVSSAPVHVQAVTWEPLVVTIETPADHARIAAGEAVTVRANVAGAGLARIELLGDGHVLASSESAPLEFVWRSGGGWHELQAAATDSLNQRAVSAPVWVSFERAERADLPTPGTPALAARSPFEMQVTLPEIAAGGAAAGLIIERKRHFDGAWEELAERSLGESEYVDAGLEPETYYVYRLAYLAEDGSRSPYSTESGETTQVELPRFAVLDVSQDLVASGVVGKMRKSRGRGVAAQKSAPSGDVAFPIEDFRPLGMSEDGDALLGGPPGEYVIWTPGEQIKTFRREHFTAHRMTRSGKVVGRLELPSTNDSFGLTLPHARAVAYTPATDVQAEQWTELTPDDRPFRIPRGEPPLPTVGFAFELNATREPFERGPVQDLPTLHDAWDMNVSGRVAGVGTVYLRPFDGNQDGALSEDEIRAGTRDFASFDDAGQLVGYRVAETEAVFLSAVNTAHFNRYTAHLNSAVAWLAPLGQSNLSWRWLGPIGVNNTRSAALLINDSGTVAGIGGVRTFNDAIDALAPTHATRISGDTPEFDGDTPVITDLGTLGGGLHSGPSAINAGGEIVGHSDFGVVTPEGIDTNALANNYHAAYWGPTDTAPDDLGSLGPVPELGFPHGFSTARGINKHGLIVGESIRPAFDTQGVPFDPGVCGVTPTGEVVTLHHPPATVGAMWRENRNRGAPGAAPSFWEIVDLNGRFNTPNFHLLNSVAINDLGYILGKADYAIFDAAGQFERWQPRSVVLVPVQVDLTPERLESGLQTITVKAIVRRFNAQTGDLEAVPDGAQVKFTVTGSDGSVQVFFATTFDGIAELTFNRQAGVEYNVTADVISAEVGGRRITFREGVVRDDSKLTWRGIHFPMPVNDAGGTRYLKLGLDGWPQPDERPQAHAEQRNEPEETFIDALNLHLHHSVTDIYVPLVGGELSLAVRRTLTPEIWHSNHGLWPWERPDRPFGVNWRSTLSAGIQFVYQRAPAGKFDVDADYAYVTDEQGAQYRFLMIGSSFYPLPQADHELDVYQSTLRQEGESYVFTKKNGSIYRFELTTIVFDLPTDRLRPGQSQLCTDHQFARVTEITDRYGSQLLYSYPHNFTLTPSEISTGRGQSIQIRERHDGLVQWIRDPRGHFTTFEYEEQSYIDPSGDERFFNALVRVNRPADKDTPEAATQYRYEFAQEKDTIPPIEEEFDYQTNLTAIVDGEGHTHEFGYAWDHARKVYVPTQGHFTQTGVPRYVALSRLPGGLGTARFLNDSRMLFTAASDPQFSGYRRTEVTDAAGAVHKYVFSGNRVIRLNAVKQLYGESRSIPDWMVPHMVVFTAMDVTRAGIGSESYHFNLEAGMRPDFVRDLSGNVTRFEYRDVFNYSAFHPGLPAVFPVVRHPDPTAQVDALGHRRSFTYGPYRQVATVLDEEGRRTVFGFGPQGQRISEQRYDSAGALVQQAAWTYSDPDFPAFATRATRTEAGSGATPLDTEFVADWYGRTAEEIRDASGVRPKVRHEYDDASQRISTTDGRELTTHFVSDAQGRLRQIEDPSPDGDPANAPLRDFFYDRRGLKVAEVDQKGNTRLWVHDARGRTVAEGRDLNKNGQLDDGEPLIERSFNAVGSVTDVYDGIGNRTHTDYDPLERPRLITDALGNSTQLFYGINSGGALWDSSGFHPTRTVDRRGFTTNREYDSRYRLRAEQREYEPGLWSERTFGYDRAGNLTSETDARQQITRHGYDALSRRASTVFPDQTSVSWSYGPSDEAVSATDERGFTTTTLRDGAGRVRAIIGPPVADGHPRTETDYDAAGNVIESRTRIDAGRMRTTTWTYDERNRRIGEQRADGTTLAWAYDDAGNVIAERDARGNVTDKEYDAADRLLAVLGPPVLLPDGSTARPRVENDYDAAGNVIASRTAVQPGEVRTILNRYDALNRLESTTDAAGQTTMYGYDAEGHRRSVADARTHTTQFRYDGLGRVTSQTDHLGRATTHQFDGAVELARNDAEGRRTTYGYDPRLRLKTGTYAGRPEDNRTYAYDAAGNLTAVTQPGNGGLCSVGYDYDAANRLISETSAGVTHQYAYDLAGSRTRTLLGGTARETLAAYDLLGRLTSLNESGRVTTYGYDNGGNPVRQTMPGGGGEITRTYDALNRLHSISGSSYVAVHRYTLAGELVRLEESYPAQTALNRTVTNGYDAIGRLTSETVTGAGSGVTSYSYDAAGNRVRRTRGSETITYTCNALNQLISQSSNVGTSATYSYDLDGNRTSRVSTLLGEPDAVYEYDHEHRLIGVETLDLTGAAVSHGYLYDYRTRRVGRSEAGQGTASVFSGGQSVADYPDGTMLPSVEYQRGLDLGGGGVGGLLYSLRAEQPNYSYSNHRGDIVARRNGGGMLTWAANYEAFGTRPLELGTDPDRQRANTKEEDPTGLLNEGHRYRDLATGTFLTRDPAGFIDGPNLYAYVSQNPWSKFDPQGLNETTGWLETGDGWFADGLANTFADLFVPDPVSSKHSIADSASRAGDINASTVDRVSAGVESVAQSVLGAVEVVPVVGKVGKAGKNISSLLSKVADDAAGDAAKLAKHADAGAEKTAKTLRAEAGAAQGPKQLEFGFVPFVERQTTARDFYRGAGWSDARSANHRKGIDFNYPVEPTTVSRGSVLSQHAFPGDPTGNYFANAGTPAMGLGIYPHGRAESFHRATSDVPALHSTAASMTDTWSVPGWAIDVPGGNQQLFIPNKGAMQKLP